MAAAVRERIIFGQVLRDTYFFLPTALLQLILVLWGFGPRFFWTPEQQALHPTMLSDRAPFTVALFLIHGGVFASWMLLYVAQCGLIALQHRSLHRRLGQVSVALIPTCVVLGLAISLEGLRVGFHINDTPQISFATSSSIFALSFGAFAWLGLRQRGTPPAHKRWMMLATMIMTGPGTARISEISALAPSWFDPTSLFLLALAIWDLTLLRRLHPVTFWGGLAYLPIDMGVEPLVASEPWLAMMRTLGF